MGKIRLYDYSAVLRSSLCCAWIHHSGTLSRAAAYQRPFTILRKSERIANRSASRVRHRNSSLPKDLHERGYDVRPADPPQGQRIVPAARVEEVLTEGSTRTTIRTLREGIVRVQRFEFLL
jgi:hypothetical protein